MNTLSSKENNEKISTETLDSQKLKIDKIFTDSMNENITDDVKNLENFSKYLLKNADAVDEIHTKINTCANEKFSQLSDEAKAKKE